MLSHLGAITGEPGFAAGAVGLVAWGASTARLPAGRAALLGALVLALAAIAALIVPVVVLYLPPLAIYPGLGALFAVSLRRGREPIVSRFARLERGGGELPPDLLSYTRVLTVLWVLFFAIMGCVSLGLALWASVETWSLFTNLIGYLLVAAFFVGEYFYRRQRYRHYRHGDFVEFLRRIPSYRLGAEARHGRPVDGL